MDGFNDWLTATALSQAIQVNFWVIPTLQIVHIIALAVLFVSSLVLALRVLGRAWTQEGAGELAVRFSPVIWTCLAVLLVSGALLITAEPGRTLTNISFYLKMSMLVVALALTVAVISAAKRARLSGAHRGMVIISMVLWACIIVAGRYIAYT